MTIRAELPPLEADTTPPPPRWTRRRIAVTALITTLLLALVGAGIGWAVYANTYQPLGPAGFSQNGPSMRQNMKVVDDHLGDRTYVGLGRSGTQITADYTIANNGSRDIVILGAANSESAVPMRLEWGPPTIELADGSGTSPAYPRDARSFPATIKAHQAIQLFVTMTKPGCAAHSSFEIFGVPIRWKALGVHHVTDMPLAADSDFYPIAVCAPAEALRLATD